MYYCNRIIIWIANVIKTYSLYYLGKNRISPHEIPAITVVTNSVGIVLFGSNTLEVSIIFLKL